MDQPLILLDVDGVLNPMQRRDISWEKGKASARGKSYNINYNPLHGEMLQALAAKTGAQLVWATTWCDDANTSIAPLVGLPELPVIDVEGESPIPHEIGAAAILSCCHKTPAVANYVKGRPFVWFDDDLTRHDAQYFRDHPEVGHFKLINVSQRWGLNSQQMYYAELWLLGLRDGVKELNKL